MSMFGFLFSEFGFEQEGVFGRDPLAILQS
jgi:hypothetical protein